MIQLWQSHVSTVKLLDADEEHTHGQEPFKSTKKWLLFSAIFGVNCFEECYCQSQGHQLKPMNVKVALPCFVLICDLRILCATDPMSLNCISFALVEAKHFLHMNIHLVYMLWMSICLTHLGSNKPTVLSYYVYVLPSWHICPGQVQQECLGLPYIGLSDHMQLCQLRISQKTWKIFTVFQVNFMQGKYLSRKHISWETICGYVKIVEKL